MLVRKLRFKRKLRREQAPALQKTPETPRKSLERNYILLYQSKRIGVSRNS